MTSSDLLFFFFLCWQIFTTLHKAKGLEFDHVELTNDFIDLTKNSDKIIAGREANKPVLFSEHLNCLYVAVTRARRILGINPTFASLLEANVTGSDRWILYSKEDGQCGRCLGHSATLLFNDSLHRDRQEVLCVDCTRKEEEAADPVVAWTLSLTT